MPNPLTGLTQIKSTDITDGAITDAKISPSANITSSKTEIETDLSDTNTPFNIGVLGYKHAVNEGLTVYNLVDGIVDEFHSEDGVDTSENSNANYDSTSDFYENKLKDNKNALADFNKCVAVSYTHLTLPTILLV